MGVAAVQGLLLMCFLIVHIGFREVTRGTCLYIVASSWLVRWEEDTPTKRKRMTINVH